MMTMTLLLAGLALAAGMGIYEAWTKQRGVAGWTVNIVASAVGGIAAGMALPMLVVTALNPGRDGAFYIGMASVVIGVVAGSSIALWIVNRFR